MFSYGTGFRKISNEELTVPNEKSKRYSEYQILTILQFFQEKGDLVILHIVFQLVVYL